MSQSIEINIDELVLHGFSPADRLHISEAVQRELTSIFSQQGLPSTLQKNIDLPFIDSGSFQMKPGASATSIGNQIAGSVYSGFNADKKV